jgi:hypothetical protein
MWIAIGGQWPHGMVLLHREGEPHLWKGCQAHPVDVTAQAAWKSR